MKIQTRCAFPAALTTLALIALSTVGCTGGANGPQASGTEAASSPPVSGNTASDDDEVAKRLRLMSEALNAEPPSLEVGDQSRPQEAVSSASPAQANLYDGVDVSTPDAARTTGLQPRRPSGNEAAAERAEPTPAERRTMAAHELAGLLRAQAQRGISPMPALMQLAALELIEPGIFNTHYLGFETPGLQVQLADDDLELLKAWRDLFSETRAGLDTSGEMESLPETVDAFAAKLRDWRPLEIAQASLCTRVDGFGIYQELRQYDDKYKLLAGRRHRLIVYVEIDQFSYRQTSREGRSGYLVEMTQDLNLFLLGYSRPDDESKSYTLNAWSLTDQGFEDFSRNKRRDFFVVQIIELPETLSVGSYNLKITMRDRNSGDLAETLLPIDIVADGSALKDE